MTTVYECNMCGGRIGQVKTNNYFISFGDDENPSNIKIQVNAHFVDEHYCKTCTSKIIKDGLEKAK